MQSIKEKLNDMSAMRKAKAEAKEEEKAEKELAKTRVEVAHEVRMAREAEAAMDLHVNKAANKVAQHQTNANMYHSIDDDHEGAVHDPFGLDTGNTVPSAATGYSTNRSAGPPRNNLL